MDRFEEIYSENYQAMFRTARKMVGNSDDVHDIVQDVFIQFFDNIKKGIIILHPRSWLYRVTLNKSVDYLRGQKRFQNIESVGETGNDDEADIQETKEAINLAISKLKPKEKKLLVLYSEGLSYKEIAEASGIKFTSVGKMLSRALKRLEQELKDQNYELY